MSIEKTLGLDEKEIERRLAEEERRIPEIARHHQCPYIKQRLKSFDTPELNILYYHARHNPSLFQKFLDQYSPHNGNATRTAVLEKLRERYVLEKLSHK